MLDETMDLRDKSVTIVNDRYMRPESAYMRGDICGNIANGQHEGKLTKVHMRRAHRRLTTRW